MFARLFGKAPADHGFRIVPAGLDLRITAGETLLQAALRQGVPFPHNCRAGGCGQCKCRLVEGKVKELTDKSYLLSAEEIGDNFILACQSMPRSDVVVSVELRAGPDHPVVERTGTIAELYPLTHDILRLTLDLDGPIAFTPGQHAQLAPTDIAVDRAYSFAACPGEDSSTSRVVFFIRKVPGGILTEWLFGTAQPGMTMKLSGPFGDFCLRPSAQPILCVAGGSGLAPVVAMIEQERQTATRPRDLVLFFGARTQADLYLMDEIRNLQQGWPTRFDVHPVLSGEPDASGWPGKRGLVHQHLKAELGERLAAHQAYLCGPPPMIDACLGVLAEEGLSPVNVHFDKFLDQSHLNS